MDEPIAAAIGAGVDITKPFGNLIVDIGAGTTDVAVISVGGVVVSASVKVAGDNFDHAIMNYVREKHSLFIGEDAAENIKIKIGTASEEADLRTMEVKGRNIITGLPKVATLTSEEIRPLCGKRPDRLWRQSMAFLRKHRQSWRQISWTEESFLQAEVPCCMEWMH